MTTWILTHGDADGVCSGALALAANPNSHVYFTHPAGLAEDLNVVEPGDSLIVCDISLSENTLGEVLDKLRLVAEHGQLIYIDHHPLPEGLSPYEVPGEFVHGVGVCASELTYRFFEDRLSRDMSRIAVYGAIGDYADDTPYIRRLVQDWDKRVLYFETGILIQALDAIGRNYERKRGLVWMLSENIPPSADDELVELALEQTRRDEKLRLRVKNVVRTIGPIAYVLDVGGSPSKAAIYARAYAGKPVGLAGESKEDREVVDMSLRAVGEVDLNIALRRIAPRFGGSGGGHPKAAGARIPIDKFNAFLRALAVFLSSQLGATTY